MDSEEPTGPAQRDATELILMVKGGPDLSGDQDYRAGAKARFLATPSGRLTVEFQERTPNQTSGRNGEERGCLWTTRLGGGTRGRVRGDYRAAATSPPHDFQQRDVRCEVAGGALKMSRARVPSARRSPQNAMPTPIPCARAAFERRVGWAQSSACGNGERAWRRCILTMCWYTSSIALVLCLL